MEIENAVYRGQGRSIMLPLQTVPLFADEAVGGLQHSITSMAGSHRGWLNGTAVKKRRHAHCFVWGHAMFIIALVSYLPLADGIPVVEESRGPMVIAPPVPESWRQPLPDFPAQLHPATPPARPQDVAVFTINALTTSDYALDLARRSGTDLLIRGWFKWGKAPRLDSLREFPERAHRMGALFGGGITCSALYDKENGITPAQLRDMATRNPEGELVDAWNKPGLRHGSLSSPAYLDYLFRWCREQIDAGVDYLFMDENTAALIWREGYDDHSLADFRQYLLGFCPLTREWQPNDPRWASQYKIALSDPAICPDGTLSTFDYRAFLRAKGLLENPLGKANPLAPLWYSFRDWRDDRAWKWLTDRIRSYARQQGQTVWISANGLVHYVDLQVLGVGRSRWLVKNGQVDLSQNQIQTWHDLVVKGRELTDQTVPVVLFHDWGMGDPPFPWMAVPPSQREIWLRTRAAEIYAAGAFFAFPVLGPHGCDAGRDGTLATIIRQTAFYQAHRNLYLHGHFLGADSVQSDQPALSLAAWAGDTPNTVVLHVINRQMRDGQLEPRKPVILTVPLSAMPEAAEAMSPDWPGTRPVSCVQSGSQLRVSLPEVEAYAVIRLHYRQAPDLARLIDPVRIRLSPLWKRPARNEFTVRPDGTVEQATDLNALLQGRLHEELVNPPTFLLQRERPTTLTVHVRTVALQGARLVVRLDGELARAVDLPNRNGKNDSHANDYDQRITLTIPAGAHRVRLENPGADWLVMDWLEFTPSL